MPSLRSLFSKTIDLEDGRQLVQAFTKPVRFEDADGVMRDVDTSVEPLVEQGKVGVEKAAYKFSLHPGKIGFDYVSRQGGAVSIELLGDFKIPAPLIEDNKVIFNDVVEGLDIVFVAHATGIKCLRVLKSAKSPMTWVWSVTGDETGFQKVSAEMSGMTADGKKVIGLSIADVPTKDGFIRTENWNGTVALRDPVTRILTPSKDVIYPVSIDPDITETVTNQADAGRERVNDHTWADNQMRLGISYGYYRYHTGIRFQTVAVPQGATIASAILTVNVFSRSGGTLTATLYGAAEDDTVVWSNSILPSNRSATAASVSVPYPSGTGAVSYDVTSIVQEIVNRPGFVSGNDISFFMLSSGGLGDGIVTFSDSVGVGTDPKLEITLQPAPTVSSVSANSGPTSGGTTVTITGANFVATPTVTFGGSSATNVVRVNATTLTCTTPAHAAGAVDVVVTNPDTQTGTGTGAFTYIAPAAATSSNCSITSGCGLGMGLGV